MKVLEIYRPILLRIAYLFIGFGLLFSAWPEVLYSQAKVTDPDSVVQAFLSAISVLALFGVVYPMKLLPIMLFEFLWKLVWVLAYGLPAIMDQRIDEYGTEVFFACVIGLVITPIVMPWKYVLKEFLLSKPEPWINR